MEAVPVCTVNRVREGVEPPSHQTIGVSHPHLAPIHEFVGFVGFVIKILKGGRKAFRGVPVL